MNEISVNYRHQSEKTIHLLASRVHTALTTEPCLHYFPTITPPASQLGEHNGLLREALAMETSTSVVALRKSRCTDVIDTLTEIAANLEFQAKGDLSKLAATGFDLKKKPHRSGAPTEVPQNVRVYTTTISGEILAKCKAVPGARSYELQYSYSANGPWIDIDPSTSSQKMLITGLERGKDIYVRVRAFGPNGYSGWSDIATLMVV